MSSRRRFLLASAAAAVRGDARWQLPNPHPYRTVDLVWVPMTDGVRLAVRLWIPEGAEQNPVPAVMEYIPYGRMARSSAAGAQLLAPYGIAFARPDVRGSGDSEGVLLGEYLQQQLEDAVTLIDWLAAQPWCNGNIGVRGNSWGGFAALQIASMQPKPLKAIMAHCASDNRYTDDVHYVGGVLLLENFEWGMMFQTLTASPPDPAFVGDRWREMWKERLKAVAPVITQWTRHQRFDAFWQHGSVQTDYSRIQCPVYVVGGQVDSYRDFLPRLLTNLKVRRKGLMGPWNHGYPHLASPGPGLDWKVEEVRWWRQWLIGENTGIMDEPMLRVYLNAQTPSEVWPADVPGRWVSENRWPSPSIRPLTLFINDTALAPKQQRRPGVRTVRSQETLGVTKRFLTAFDLRRELPPDQTPDDRRSCVFDSAPLEADLEICGNPTACMRLSSSEPVARIALRLNEVTPDDRSWNVSWALLNLTHRLSHEDPSLLRPGQLYDIDVSCYFTAHRFRKGNRIRLAVSESLWPMVWPSPQSVELRLTTGASFLRLPVRPREHRDQTPPIPLIRRPHVNETPAGIAADPLPPTDEGTVLTVEDSRLRIRRSASIREGNPRSCLWTGESRTTMKRHATDVAIVASFRLTSTPVKFHLIEMLKVIEGQTVLAKHRWEHDIPRDHQ